MSHPALHIIDAAEALLVSAGLTVIRNPLRPAASVPAVALRMGADEVTGTSLTHTDRRLDLITELLVSPSDKADLDSQTLTLRHTLEQTLLPDGALGLPFVLQVEPATQQEPQYQGDGERPLGVTTVIWPIHYRHRHPQ